LIEIYRYIFLLKVMIAHITTHVNYSHVEKKD